jgi:hypothetical protein
MAYLRYDIVKPFSALEGNWSPVPMFSADGSLAQISSPISGLNVMANATSSPRMIYPVGRMDPEPQAQLPKIKNINNLQAIFGPPDVVDTQGGGIAIWSANKTKKAGYDFLHRIEIIDENIPSLVPVYHFSNLYIWVHMKPSQEQLLNIMSLSKDYMYDSNKQLMVIRSDTLNTAMAQAALLKQYINGTLTFYNLVNNKILLQYYVKSLPKSKHSGKVNKLIFKILKK